MRKKFHVGKYGSYPYGTLTILERDIAKEINNISKLTEKLRENIQENQTILETEHLYSKQNAEEKTKHLKGDYDFVTYFSLAAPTLSLIYFWTLPNVSFANSWFLIVLIPFFSGFLDYFLSFLTNRDERAKKYEFAYNREYKKQSKNYFKKEKISKKKLEQKIKDLQEELEQLEKEEEFLDSVKYKIPELKDKAKQRERTAKIEAYEGRIRDGSQIVRKRLLRSIDSKKWKCPYCNKKKSSSKVVADHIYPVSKGGLSTLQNMVLICYKCNEDKSDLTLRNFCKKHKFNYDSVVERLESLGKDI